MISSQEGGNKSLNVAEIVKVSSIYTVLKEISFIVLTCNTSNGRHFIRRSIFRVI